jgi:hypothetical protein
MRWAVIGSLVVAGFTIWLTLGEGSDLRRSRAIQLGQHRSEVNRIMGSEGFHYADGMRGGAEVLWGRWQLLMWDLHEEWSDRLPLKPYRFHPSNWPVQIEFGPSDTVERIRRGSEIIEAPPASQQP